MKKILSTERLVLREIDIKDAPFIFKLMNSEGWLNFIGDRGIRTEEDAKNYIVNSYLKSYKDNGYGSYLLVTKNDQTILGICGLFNRPQLEDVDIGFALLPEFFGKGYAFEAATAIMDYAHNVLQIKKITAITDFKNKTSQKLLEKIGLHFEKPILYNTEELMLFSN